MTSKPVVDIPNGSTTVNVHLINPVNFGPAQIHRFMAPPVPGLETFKTSPSHSFYIEHPSGRKLVFDLGIRKDYQNYSKSIADYLPTTKYNIEVSKNVADILQESGVELSQIEAVIWSHWHWEFSHSHLLQIPVLIYLLSTATSVILLPSHMVWILL
jgi:hypothetical protein